MESASNEHSKDKPLSEEQVARYLRNHPGFFLQHEDLLADIKLTHNSGQAVSLLERQVSILRERNQDMRHRLSNLLENAQRNDQLFDKTKRLILGILEAQRPEELSKQMTRHLVNDFDIDTATLILFADPSKLGNSQLRVTTLETANRHIGSLLKNSKAACGILREEENQFLFGDEADRAGSAAVVPLYGHSLIGVIAIGNRDPQHFRSSMGTLFLNYIADVLVRVLPHHLRNKS